MTNHRLWFPVTVFVALVALAVVPSVSGAPHAQAGENLLTNPDFEEPLPDDDVLFHSGPGWKAWHLAAPDGCHDQGPDFELSVGIAERNHSGDQALQIGARDATYTAGVYQKVADVTPGQTYKFSVWGHVLYATSATATASDGPDPRMKVGIDPTGGINPFADTVRWSEPDWEFDAHYQFSVVATAEKSTITVFTYATQPECVPSNFTFWDDAELVTTDEPETSPDAAAAWSDTFRDIAADALIQTTTTEFTVGGEVTTSPEESSEAAPEASATGTGSICLLMYMDDDASGSRDVQEAKLAGGIFTLNDGSQVVATYTTDGVGEPYCFSNLTPGNYTLTWRADDYEATTTQGWAASLEPGETLSREFGAVEASSDGQSSREGGLSRLLRSLLIAGAVIIILLGVGGGVVWVLSRRAGDDDEPPPRSPSIRDTAIRRPE